MDKETIRAKVQKVYQTNNQPKTNAASSFFQKSKKAVGDFFAPSPDEVRVRDVAREIPKTVADIPSKVARVAASFLNPKNTGDAPIEQEDGTFKANPVNFADFFKEVPNQFSKQIGQPAFRAFGGVASQITGEPFTPTGEFQKNLYGTDKPLSLSAVGREGRGGELDGESKGVFKVIDPAFGLFLGVADATPTGKQVRGLLSLGRNSKQVIARSKDVTKIATLLKREVPEMTDDIAKAFAKIFRQIDNVDDVDSAINNIQFQYRKAGTGVSKATQDVKTSVQRVLQSSNKVDDVVPNKIGEISKLAENSLENSTTGIRPKTVEYLRSNPDEITKGEVRLREIEDGRIVIEDGRHRLQAAKETGITPKLVDVTEEYTGEPSKKVANLIAISGRSTPKPAPIRGSDGKFLGSVSNKVDNLDESFTKTKNLIESEYEKSKDLFKLSDATPSEKSKVLQKVSRNVYEELAKDTQINNRATVEAQLSKLFEGVFEKGQINQEELRKVWQQIKSDASRGLQQTPSSDLALPKVSHETPPYSKASDNLLGFSKDGNLQKGYNEQNYKFSQPVEVKFDDGTVIQDEIKGLNKPHALERARRNWPNATIKAINRPPSEAYGAVAGFGEDEEGKIDFDPTRAALGAVGIGSIRGIKAKIAKQLDNLPKALQDRALALEFKIDAIENSTLNNKLNRLLVDREGRVRELGDIKNNRKLTQFIEDRIAESGLTDDPTEFASKMEKFFDDKKALAKEIDDFNEEAGRFIENQKAIFDKDSNIAKTLDEYPEVNDEILAEYNKVFSEKTPSQSIYKASQQRLSTTPTSESPLDPQNLTRITFEQEAKQINNKIDSYRQYATELFDSKEDAITQLRMFDIFDSSPDLPKLANNIVKAVPEFKELKDISGFKGQARDIYRNTEQVFGKNFEKVREELLQPFDNAKGDFIDEQKKLIQELDENVVKKFGIRKKSKESRAIMDYGEGLVSQEEVIKQFGKDRANDIFEATAWFRKRYDTLLDEINAVRKVIYPHSPEKLIPRRKDYFRHFQDLSGGWGGFLSAFETPSGISPSLAGISPFTKPRSKFLSFAQKRFGEKSERDAVGGFINYIQPFAYGKHIDPQIGRFRTFAKTLAEQTEESRNINNYIEFIHDYANDLAGKTSAADRYIQKVIPYGRTAFRLLNLLNNRVKANIILGNFSSSIAQIFNVPQGIGSAKQHSVYGAIRTLGQIQHGQGVMAKSNFIKERYSGSMYDKFDVGLLDNGKKMAAWLIGVLDEVGTKFIWNSHYEKAIRNGAKNPITYADNATRSLVAGRGVGEVPLLQKSKVFQLVAPFQLEVGNLWWALGDFMKKKDFAGIATTFVAMYLMNQVAEKIRGSDVGFDPVNASYEAYKIFDMEDNIGKGLFLAGGRLSGEVLSNVPLGQTFAAMYPEYGTKIGDIQLPTRENLFGDADPTRFGSGLLAVKAAQDPLFKILPPFGGGQLKKTFEGGKALLQGDVTDKDGNVLYRTDKSGISIVKNLLFGKYSTKEAQEYFNKDKYKNAVESEMLSLYKANKDLIANGQEGIAKSNIEQLSDEAYEIYKKVKSETVKKETEILVKKMLPTARQLRALVEEGKNEEAQQVVDEMSDEEYEIYEKAKKKLSEKSFEEKTSETNVVDTVWTYAKAIGVDPVTAFNRIYTGQRIRRVDNGAIIVERLPFSESTDIKVERGATEGMKLDHTIPLQLGGSNAKSNLKLVSDAEWASYTPVENHLGKLLRDKKISDKKAKDLIIQFKNGEIKAEEILKIK